MSKRSIRKSRSAQPPMMLEGLEGRTLFAGTGLAAAYFARTNLTLAKYSELDPAVNFNWTGGTPAAVLGTDGFSVRWTGQVLAHFSETYTFKTLSTGGVRLWVNNFLVIDAWANHAQREDAGSLRLTAGKLFDIRLEYWSDGNSPKVELDWQSTRNAREVVPTNRLVPAVLDTVSPTTPGRFRASSPSSGVANLLWDASTDPSGVVAYDVYLGSSKLASLLPNQTSYTRGGLTPGVGYVFSVQAIDAAGHASALATTAITTSAPSNLPPTVPTNLHVVSSDDTSITLQWNGSTDDGSVAGYRIYRNGVKLAAGPTSPMFTDTGLQPGTQYTYTVRAADNTGLFSAYSSAVSRSTSAAPSHDAFGGINAGDYDQSSGVTNGSNEINSLDNGDWVLYKNVDFGSGADSIKLDLAMSPNNRGGAIEFRLDSMGGTLINSFNLQPTGSSSTFQTEQTNISHTTGKHDLYVLFKNRSDVAHLRKITFSSTHLVRVMALGDSITQTLDTPQTPSYRWYLYQKLINAGITDFDFVGSQTQTRNNGNPPNFNFDQDHEGHSGWRADEIAASINGWAQTYQPEVVMLHIGTNDLVQGQDVSSTIGDIESIIDNLRNAVPNVTILLAQILPLSGHDSDVDALNAGIATLASQKNLGNSPVILVDQNSGISTSDLSDGIHPKSATESTMADRWYTALAPLLQ